jgi:hypothetical protein
MGSRLAPALFFLPAVAAVGAEDCPAARASDALPSPEAVLAEARAPGLDLTLAEPIAPLPADPLGGAEDSHACSGKIRPGSQLAINDAFLCTLNWVLRGEVGALYVGTAGHCIRSPAPTRL